MEQAWRWFGESDPVTLDNVRQAGARSVVSALHQAPLGVAWDTETIARRKALIEAAGLNWTVCESIPVPDAIKIGGAGAAKAIGVFKDTLARIGRAGIATVCYNFMPVVDWTRTELMFPRPNAGYALRFDMIDFVGYDVFVLARPFAADSYPPEHVALAQKRMKTKSAADLERLEATVIHGLPGAAAGHDRDGITALIEDYRGIDAGALRENLRVFLSEVVPIAEEVGVRLAIHPDDPPFPLFGLPRIVSTAADIRAILSFVDSAANGLTFCTGSLGARGDNDVTAMAKEFRERIAFAHLRNVTCETDGSFFEDEHLGGGTDMVAVVDILLREQRRRRMSGDERLIPMRPDHGHLLADDIEKHRAGLAIQPGYSLIGRLKGLAELRGVMAALDRTPTN